MPPMPVPPPPPLPAPSFQEHVDTTSLGRQGRPDRESGVLSSLQLTWQDLDYLDQETAENAVFRWLGSRKVKLWHSSPRTSPGAGVISMRIAEIYEHCKTFVKRQELVPIGVNNPPSAQKKVQMTSTPKGSGGAAQGPGGLQGKNVLRHVLFGCHVLPKDHGAWLACSTSWSWAQSLRFP